MERKKMVILLLVLIAGIGAIHAWREYNRTNKDLLKETAEVHVDASTLIHAYQKDTAAFHRHYTQKLIAVQGVVRRKDDSENPVVLSLGSHEGLSLVQCSMDSTHTALYKNIEAGTKVTLKGLCTGGRTDELFGTDVILARCVPDINQ